MFVSAYFTEPAAVSIASLLHLWRLQYQRGKGDGIQIIRNGCPEVIIQLQQRSYHLPGDNGLEDAPDSMLLRPRDPGSIVNFLLWWMGLIILIPATGWSALDKTFP